jgi:hypothetical protein
MAKCSVCGNEYDRTMEIRVDGAARVFDSFTCAIHALAPTCANCGVRIIGHGMQSGGAFYCCAHCARTAGVKSMQDRA